MYTVIHMQMGWSKHREKLPVSMCCEASTRSCPASTQTPISAQAPSPAAGQIMTTTPPTTRPQKAWYYTDTIMGAMASQITSLTIVCSTVYSGAHQRKHQSPASLTIVRGIHRWPVNSPQQLPVTRKMFPFDDVIMERMGWKHIKVTANETRTARIISETHCWQWHTLRISIYLQTDIIR